MKILFLTSSMQGGGAERVASLLSNAWVAQGHKVTLMPTFSGRGGCSYALHPGVRIDYLADHVNGARGKLRRLWALRRLIRQTRPDVVVSFLTDVNVAALLAASGSGVPVVVSERTYPPRRGPQLRLLIKILRRRAYRWAAVVVSQTEDTKAWIAGECPGANNVVIPNPLIYPVLSANPVVTPQSILAEGRRCLVAVGRLDEGKRFHLLIDAFARLAPQHPDWDLAILGEGAERATLAAKIAAADLGARVHMPGFVGNPGDWYQRASIYVMTSAYEGFPNTLLEAMAYGLPAVAFDIKTGPREIMQDGHAGVLLPDDDHVTRLVDALDALIRDEGRRAALGQIAQAVRDRYSMGRILGLWGDVLAKAVYGKGGQ